MVNRWGNNGNSDRFFGGVSKITADGDFRHDKAQWKIKGTNGFQALEGAVKFNRSHFGLYQSLLSSHLSLNPSHAFFFKF